MVDGSVCTWWCFCWCSKTWAKIIKFGGIIAGVGEDMSTIGFEDVVQTLTIITWVYICVRRKLDGSIHECMHIFTYLRIWIWIYEKVNPSKVKCIVHSKHTKFSSGLTLRISAHQLPSSHAVLVLIMAMHQNTRKMWHSKQVGKRYTICWFVDFVTMAFGWQHKSLPFRETHSVRQGIPDLCQTVRRHDVCLLGSCIPFSLTL